MFAGHDKRVIMVVQSPNLFDGVKAQVIAVLKVKAEMQAECISTKINAATGAFHLHGFVDEALI